MGLLPRPSHERKWTLEHSRLPEFVVEGDRVTVSDVRAFHWFGPDSARPEWEDRSYSLAELQRVWYVLTPFSTAWRGPAHALVSFQFGGDDSDEVEFLGISVEARREVGETYGLLKGLLRRFELIYVAGDERDLIGLRAVHRPDQVYVYPARVEPEGVRRLFLQMAGSANRLREEPEFYNTITNNCTTRLVRHVNRVAPRRVPRSWKILIPGYSDALVHRLGLLDTEGSLAEARARWLVNERAEAWFGDPAFSRRIRERGASGPSAHPPVR